MPKVFSFDAETDGLWGAVWAIGAIVYDDDGTELARFAARLPDTAVSHSWVRENVLPQVRDIPVTHETHEEMLSDFAKFYLAEKAGAEVVVHMGYIVEAKVLRDMYDRGFIGAGDGPFPLHDVAGNLQQAGADPTSLDAYIKAHDLKVGYLHGGTHNPLYDSAAAAAVYRHLLSRRDAPS